MVMSAIVDDEVGGGRTSNARTRFQEAVVYYKNKYNIIENGALR